MRLIALWSLLFSAVQDCHLFAQQPVLEKWRTATGSEAEGLFHEFDAEANVVTLLVPKAVPLDRLDEASRKLALEHAARQGKPEVKDATDDDVSPALSFANTSIAEWIDADRELRREYCASSFHFLISQGLASESLKSQIHDMRSLMRIADSAEQTLAVYLELFAEHRGKDFEKDSEGRMGEVFMHVAGENKWLGRDTTGLLMADDMVIRGLKMKSDGRSFDFIGQLYNSRTKDAQLATIELAFYDNEGSILGTVADVVVGLPAGQSRPIKMKLFAPDFTPDLGKVRMYVKSINETAD